MAGRGKSVSISYGDFRCTLDRFDDPLQTMTAILDYLRYIDAIASDTGTAPDQPDIDILTGIAARGRDGKIAAQEQDGTIHLRVAGPGHVDAPDIPPPDAPEIPPPDAQGTPAPRSADAACETAARVLRVRRADLDRRVDHGVPDETAETADCTLPQTAEIALQRDLARIEAGAEPDTPPPEPPVLDPPAPPAQTDDVARIFNETDSHLGAPASSRRRNAIQHLRAALAATRADRRPAPLRLGADQRVDAPQDPKPPPPCVHPAPADFAAFVARAKPAGLPALVEAAAAYLTDCEGQARFSRPMLMERLDLIGVADTREDMLRAFETVLRAGKLRKCSDGRYAITDSAGYRTASR